ncbi:CG2794 [Drosophila busckii]|uniref:CG2794 n=1 Tax=Drosophila busckii TaxID=30019 RepID=A0A0M4E876_DROBS|nr:CG2794 [Drosophila busckii]
MLLRKCCYSGSWAIRRAFATKQAQILVHPEIKYALEQKHPIVALESTIITHGMPLPENVETALQVEQQVRSQGALPATIGIIDGCIKVGLTKEELTELAHKPREHVIKCSRRDLPYVVAKAQSGGTTVATTMLIAERVGIKIFATGGIGGVHREGHVTLDISADLVELGRTPVAVVCSGVKSILDIPRTLEVLETQGVCVASYDSPGGVFPDFYTRNSGCKVPYELANPTEAAELLQAWHALQLRSGVLIGVPIPAEYAADKHAIEAAIKEANYEAQAQGISGKEVTPFLLARIAKLTKGRSLQSNIALIKNNAKVAAEIACALAKIQQKGPGKTANRTTSTKSQPVVVGASILDLSFKLKESRELQLDGATYSSVTQQTPGGVGRNLAEGIYKLYGSCQLISAVGNDQMGQMLQQLMPQALQRSFIVDDSSSTSLCSVIFDHYGDCKLILGNMEVHASITPEQLLARQELISQAPLLIMDSNISEQSMACLLELAQRYKLPVFFEPTDMFIAGKPFQLQPALTQQIRLISPNLQELRTIAASIMGQQLSLPLESQSKVTQAKLLLEQIQSHFNCIIVTLGNEGVLLSCRRDALDDARQLLELTPSQEHTVRFYAAPEVHNIVNVSGAGDSFCAGFITALLKHHTLDESVAAGFVAAERALLSDSAVPQTYFRNADDFEHNLRQTLKTLQQSI